MDDVKSRYLPTTRFTDYDRRSFCYAYGNTPPEDLLQSITADISEPEILLLGCGDIRSCLYTLWNNFDSRHPRRFKGVHFVLNDISVAVLARNIIFLYLCTQMPSDKVAIVKWVASFWSIWFCHELLAEHKQVLMDALSHLLKWSKSTESWSKRSENPLRHSIQFASTESLAKIREMWQAWFSDNRPVENIRAARKKLLKLTGADEHQTLDTHLVRFFSSYLASKLTACERKCMKTEMDFYYQNGFAFVESVLDLPVLVSTLANSTFFEGDGSYDLHGNSFPYRCFFHSFQFSTENLKKLGYSGFLLKIKKEKFFQQPLLANSIQQFAVWVKSCAEILSKSDSIMFTFQCSDAMEFCYSLTDGKFDVFCSHFPQLFDAIYASNLLDYIAPPSLVLAAMSVLKQTGFLFTETFRHAFVSPSTSGYLKAVFGFESKYLPMICGIRCISNDDEYSSDTSIKPIPCTAEFDLIYSVTTKSLVWEHTAGMPLKQVNEADFAAMVNILFVSIQHMLTYCMSDSNGSIAESLLSTATVMQLLKSFVSQLDGEEYDYTNHHFWTPLCNKLTNEKSLQALIASLQTQALLHGLHLHLIVSESDCPLCKKVPVNSFISQCSITLQNTAGLNNEPRLSILVHSAPPVDAVIIKTWREVKSACEDVHVVNSIAGMETDGQIELDFFVPTIFLQKNYYASIIYSNYKMSLAPIVSVLMHQKLSDCKIKDHCYSFSKCIKPQTNMGHSTFGKLVKHSGNADSFESLIILSDQSMSALKHYKLSVSQPSTAILKVTIGGDMHIEVSYPYPVEYSKVSIKLSRANRRIAMVAQRKRLQLFEEKPVYIANPDNPLSIPAMLTWKQKEMEHYAFVQFSAKEHALMQKVNRVALLMPPEINLKETLIFFLQLYQENFFQIACDGADDWLQTCKCFLLVQNRCFDLHNKTPAIDLHFCFLTADKYKAMFLQWISAFEAETGKSAAREIVVDEKECWLLEKTLNYFASRTVSTGKMPTSNRYKLLVNHGIAQHFTRALVYPLYPNGSMAEMGMPKPAYSQSSFCSKPEDKCSFCSIRSEHLRKCSRCRVTQYCNQDCQKKHWSTHKTVCRPLK